MAYGVRGMEVARLFYGELVGPLIERAFPGVRYAAGRLGSGSDVLGAGDEIGSRLIAARLADGVMRLAFVLAQKWMPYRKWQGTIFGSLPLAGRLSGALATAVSAGGWREREDAIVAAAGELLAVQHSRELLA